MSTEDRRAIGAAVSVIEASIEEAIDRENIPGVSIAIVLGGETLMCRGFGFADLASKRPCDGDTGYRVASITKLFTATMLMMLRDEGKVSLDDPLSKYLPEVEFESPDPDPRPITLRQLAAHAAGAPRDLEVDYFAGAEFPSRERTLELASAMPLRIPPMTAFKYSNVGMALLGYALAEVAGQPYESFVEERILRPLGMGNSGFDPQAAFAQVGATGYNRLRDGSVEPVDYFHCNGITPAGQLHSTAGDLSRFLAMQLETGPANDAQPLGGASIREMHSPVLMGPDWASANGIGWFVARQSGVVISGHGGSLPGFVSKVAVARDKKLGIAVMSNAQVDGVSWSPDKAIKAAFTEILGALGRQLEQEKASRKPFAPGEWRMYEGLYRNPFFPELEVRVAGGTLWFCSPGDPPGAEVALKPTGEHTFEMKDGANIAEPVTFLIEDGRCVGIAMPGGGLTKV